MDHWTNNEDLLERFVLNRLEKSDREPLQEHLKTCDICREAVAEEMRIAAAARRLGRDRLKIRLKDRIILSDENRIPWGRIVSAAAVVILIVGVGIYNDWISLLKTDPRLIETKDVSKSLQAEPAPPGNEKLSAPTKAEEPSPAAGATTRERSARPPSKSQEHEVAARSDEFQEKIVERVAPKAAVGEAAIREFGRGEESRQDLAIAKPTEELWVEGYIIEGSLTLEDRPADAVREVQPQAKVFGRIEDDRARLGEKGRVTTAGVQTQKFILDQQPIEKLPVSQQKQLNGKQLPILIQDTEQGLQLTLFAEQLFDSTELQNATIHSVTNDSMVVVLSQVRIGVKLPAEWSLDKGILTKTVR